MSAAVVAFNLLRRRVLLRDAAANRGSAEAEVAAAAGGEHRRHAVAARLNHLAAIFVAGTAGDRNAFFGVFDFAHGHGEIAGAAADAVHHHAAAAHLIGERFAEALKRVAGDVVVAFADDLAAVSRLFHFHGAARHHHAAWPPDAGFAHR